MTIAAYFDAELAERHKPSRKVFDARPQHVQAWVRSLPMANTGEAGCRLYDALTEANRQQIPAVDRFRFLECICDPVDSLTEALEKRYLGKAFPLAPRERMAADAVCSFQAQMAMGYKLVAVALAREAGMTARLRRGNLTLSIYQAIRYLSRVLLTSYQTYAPCPERVWHQLHELYHLATTRRVADRRVKEPGAPSSRNSSISSLYKRVLLLAVSSPYQLRQGDVTKVYAALRPWAVLCRLGPVQRNHGDPQGLFLIPAGADAPPHRLDRGKGAVSPLDWVLDTRPLGHHLRKAVATYAGARSQVEWRGRLNDLPRELVLRLMQCWGTMRKRRSLRTSKRGEQIIEVALGFSAVHHFVSGDIEFREEPGEDEDLILETSAWKTGIWQAVQRETALCYVKDESPGGYRLQWLDDQGTIQVGELVGVRRRDDAGTDYWSIGVVRWMHGLNDAGMEFGVELLAPNAESATVRACNARGDCGEPLPVLLLAGVAAANRPKTLLAPAFLADLVSHLELAIGMERTEVRIRTVLETAGLYARYEFELAGPQPKGEQLNRRREDDAIVRPKPEETEDGRERPDSTPLGSTL